MTLLDRYIIRQFAWNFLLLLGILFSVILVIDFSLQFDEYTERAVEWLRFEGNATPSLLAKATKALWLSWDLWWPRLFLLFDYLVGLVLVAAMGFTCSLMVKHREFVAMIAGGLSLQRVARPILIVALAVVLLQAYNREQIIPKLAPLLVRDKNQSGLKSATPTSQPLIADGAGRLLYAATFDSLAERIDGLWVWERDSNGLMLRRIVADSAQWVPEDKVWALTNGRVEARETGSGTSTRDVQPLATLRTDLDPQSLRLARFEGMAQNLSWSQLGELIDKLKAKINPPLERIAEYQRVRYGRIAWMLTNILALLVCLPFFLRKEPANMLVQSAWAAPAAMGAFAGGLIGMTAAIPGLPPQLSVFVPVMILIPIMIASMSSIKS
jgi:lipopolysaccharide export system permease protein